MTSILPKLSDVMAETPAVGRRILPSILSCLVLVLSLWSGAAQAQASRTWVSGVGDDNNPCSRAAPCATFAVAILKTAAGGEIDALDPGSYGPVTIHKAIAIDGGGSQVASILAVDGGSGIEVVVGPSDTVILRNLRLDGFSAVPRRGGGGGTGIRFLSGGNVSVENCDIFGFSGLGIEVAAGTASSLIDVVNTNLSRNGTAGMSINSAGGSAHATLSSVIIDQGGYGIYVDGTGGGSTALTLTRSVLSMNAFGLQADGAGAQVLLGSSHITLNGTGVLATSGASVTSNKDNQINLNGTDGTPLPSAGLN